MLAKIITFMKNDLLIMCLNERSKVSYAEYNNYLHQEDFI